MQLEGKHTADCASSHTQFLLMKVRQRKNTHHGRSGAGPLLHATEHKHSDPTPTITHHYMASPVATAQGQA
eukprot:1149906-Pelagomonas_calceolata.AAC.9